MTEYTRESGQARPAGGTGRFGREPSLGPGRPLDPFLRADMEAHLGADLSAVRLHTCGDAGWTARALGARAATVGRHVVFADGAYRPSDAAGRRLLAHELTHVVQQMRGGPEPAGSAAMERAAVRSAREEGGAGRNVPAAGKGAAVGVAREEAGAAGAAGAATQESREEESLGFVGDLAVDFVSGVVAGSGLQQRMLKAALTGFLAELGRQLDDPAVKDAVHASLKELRSRQGQAEMAGGYAAGAVAGLVSPVTDLFGLVVMGEHLQAFATHLAVGVFKGETDLAADAAALGADLRRLGDSLLGVLKQTLSKEPQKLFGLLELYGHLEEQAVRRAGAEGRKGAQGLVRSLTAKEEAGPESAQHVLATHTESEKAGLASAVSSKMSRLQRAAFHTHPARLGYGVGEAIGTVLSNLLLLVFTEGVGSAITEIAEGLGRVAPMLARAAEFLAEVGRAVTAVEQAIGKAIAWAAGKVKVLGALFRPFVELMERLQSFLRRLAGVTSKLETAVGHGAATALSETAPVPKVPLAPAAAPKVPPVPKAVKKPLPTREAAPVTAAAPSTRSAGEVAAAPKPAAGPAAGKPAPGKPAAGKPAVRKPEPARRTGRREPTGVEHPPESGVHAVAEAPESAVVVASETAVEAPVLREASTGQVVGGGPGLTARASRGGVKQPGGRPTLKAVPGRTGKGTGKGPPGRAGKGPGGGAPSRTGKGAGGKGPPGRGGQGRGPARREGGGAGPAVGAAEREPPFKDLHDAALFMDRNLAHPPQLTTPAMREDWDNYVVYAKRRTMEIGDALLNNTKPPAPPRTFESWRNVNPPGGERREWARGLEFEGKAADVFMETVDPGRLTLVKTQHHISPQPGGPMTRPDVVFTGSEGQGVAVSLKSRRRFRNLSAPQARQQARTDLAEALDKYTGAQYLRRTGEKVQLTEAWVIYEAEFVGPELRSAIRAEVAAFTLRHGKGALRFRVGFL